MKNNKNKCQDMVAIASFQIPKNIKRRLKETYITPVSSLVRRGVINIFSDDNKEVYYLVNVYSDFEPNRFLDAKISFSDSKKRKVYEYDLNDISLKNPNRLGTYLNMKDTLKLGFKRDKYLNVSLEIFTPTSEYYSFNVYFQFLKVFKANK